MRWSIRSTAKPRRPKIKLRKEYAWGWLGTYARSPPVQDKIKGVRLAKRRINRSNTLTENESARRQPLAEKLVGSLQNCLSDACGCATTDGLFALSRRQHASEADHA